MAQIELCNLTKRFGDLEAVSDVSATIKDGELLALLGPSGCGKSTTLRMIGGLETPTSGEVHIGGDDVTDDPPYDRDTSIVFQNWELFPHKSVLENVAFGLKMRKVDEDERHSIAEKMLERVEIGGYGSYDPPDLSGGQKQRVALARSLAVDPDVLLLDEPLSNLDKRLREQMEIELKEIHEDLNKTFIYVTHNQDEAFTLADRIGIMNNGRLVQIGEPTEIYQNPANQFIEEFLGDTNIVGAKVDQTSDGVVIETDFGETLPSPSSSEVEPGDNLQLSFRPEVLSLQTEDTTEVVDARTDGGQMRSTSGTVDNVLYRGGTVRYYVDIDGTSLFVDRQVRNSLDLSQGDTVQVNWSVDKLLAFHEDGTRLSMST